MADTGESDGGWDALRLCCCHGHLDGLTLDEMAAVGAPCPLAAYVAAERDRAVGEALAPVRALADEWDQQANRLPGFIAYPERGRARDLRAALPAEPTGEGA